MPVACVFGLKPWPISASGQSVRGAAGTGCSRKPPQTHSLSVWALNWPARLDRKPISGPADRHADGTGKRCVWIFQVLPRDSSSDSSLTPEQHLAVCCFFLGTAGRPVATCLFNACGGHFDSLPRWKLAALRSDVVLKLRSNTFHKALMSFVRRITQAGDHRLRCFASLVDKNLIYPAATLGSYTWAAVSWLWMPLCLFSAGEEAVKSWLEGGEAVSPLCSSQRCWLWCCCLVSSQQGCEMFASILSISLAFMMSQKWEKYSDP